MWATGGLLGWGPKDLQVLGFAEPTDHGLGDILGHTGLSPALGSLPRFFITLGDIKLITLVLSHSVVPSVSQPLLQGPGRALSLHQAAQPLQAHQQWICHPKLIPESSLPCFPLNILLALWLIFFTEWSESTGKCCCSPCSARSCGAAVELWLLVLSGMSMPGWWHHWSFVWRGQGLVLDQLISPSCMSHHPSLPMCSPSFGHSPWH